jgi:hypothetical protein
MLDIQVYVECVLKGPGLGQGGSACVREVIGILMFKGLCADNVDPINKLMKGELGVFAPLDLSAGRGGVLLIVLILKFWVLMGKHVNVKLDLPGMLKEFVNHSALILKVGTEEDVFVLVITSDKIMSAELVLQVQLWTQIKLNVFATMKIIFSMLLDLSAKTVDQTHNQTTTKLHAFATRDSS